MRHVHKSEWPRSKKLFRLYITVGTYGIAITTHELSPENVLILQDSLILTIA
jgi:hypothetical protein